MSPIRPAALVALALIAAACHGDTKTEPRNDLVDRTWRLEAFEASDGETSVPSDQELTLKMVSDGSTDAGSAEASADCNSCGGSWQLGPAGSFRIELGCTDMACPAGSLGARFEDDLARAAAWTLVGDHLWLHLGSSGEQLRFVASGVK